jgi:hypothetical protein
VALGQGYLEHELSEVCQPKWNYSGGGYVVTLLDTTKKPFPKLMHDTVRGQSDWRTALMSDRRAHGRVVIHDEQRMIA